MTTYTRRINLFINGRVVRNDVKSIRTEMIRLERSVRHMEIGSRQYIQTMARIRHLKGIIDQHNAALKTTVLNLTTMKGLANAFNKFAPLLFGFIGTFTGLSMATRRASMDFAEFDEKVTDVMKVTKKTRDEVIELNKRLLKIDTRTAQNQLLELAWVAGKLGIHGTEQIVGFVTAADQINVALSKDLGGNAEEAIRAIGKAVNIFGLESIHGIEEAMLKVGSAINELGMASVAQEGFLIKFVERVAGIAPLAGVSIESILGLAAALDMYGQKSEVSSTAYSKLMSKMATETETMAKIMGMSIRDYVTFFTEDANEAMLQLFEIMKGEGSAAFTEVVKLLGETDLEGQRMTQVMGTLVNNVERIREQQLISNKAFKEGTSVTNEFNIKNATATAIIEKKQKELKNLRVELGEKLMPVYLKSMDIYKGFLKQITAVVEWTFKHGRVIMALTTYLLIQQAALKSMLYLKGLTIFYGKIWSLIYLKLAWTYNTLTGNIHRAAAAQRLFNMIQLKNPWIALAAIILGVVAALVAYIKTKRELTLVEKSALNVKAEYAQQYADEMGFVHRLIDAINSETTSREYKMDAIRELRSIIPDYFAELDEEGKLINHNADALNNYIRAKEKEIRMKVHSEEYASLYSQLYQLEQSGDIEKAQADYDLAKSIYDAGKKANEHYISLNVKQVQMQEAEKKLNAHIQKRKDLMEAMRKVQVAISGQMRTDENWWADSRFKNEKEWLLHKRKLLHDEIAQLEKELQDLKVFSVNNPDFNLEEDINHHILLIEDLKTKLAETDAKIKIQFAEKPDFSEEAEEYQRQMLVLKRHRGDYTGMEEKFQEDLDALRLRFAEGRYKQADEESENLLKLRGTYYDLLLEKTLKEEKRIEEIRQAGVSLSPGDQEKERFSQEIKKLGLQKTGMTPAENLAFETLQEQHQQKLNDIDAKAIKERFEKRQTDFVRHIAQLEYQNQLKLNEVTSFEQAMDLLLVHYSEEELKDIKTLHDAKALLRKKQQDEVLDEQIIFYNELLEQIKNILNEDESLDIQLADDIMSEPEAEELNDRLRAVTAELTKLFQAKEKLEPKEGDDKTKAPRHSLLGVDMLGFRPDDWELFWDFADEAMTRFERIGMAMYSLANIWRDVNHLIAQQENRALQQFERNQNFRKKTLDNQLKHGLISQENYNAAIERIDLETDRKRAEIARKQARRSRNVAAFEAAVNTMVAVTSALKIPGPAGIIMAAIVGAMGAVQVEAILSQPLPEIPGMQQGGWLDLLREQDKKRYRAKIDPNRRGFINKPTILVGENPEYVVPNEAVRNPTIKPILDFFELERINNNLARVDMRAALPQITGRQSGGHFGSYASAPSPQMQHGNNADPLLNAVLMQLAKQLSQPLRTELIYQEWRDFEKKVHDNENGFNL